MTECEQRGFEDTEKAYGRDAPAEPGRKMLGDGTEEQDPGRSGKRPKLSQEEVERAFREQGALRPTD
jgi:hypothetical protein